MPDCPKCGASIDHLVYWAYELRRAKFYVRTTGKVEYDNQESRDVDEETIDYDCPKCEATLFNSEDEAVNFLHPTPTR